MDAFEPRASLGAWLHRIVANCALMRLRKERRPAETPIDDLLPAFDAGGWRRDLAEVPDDDPGSVLLPRRTAEFVRARIDLLRDAYRTALLLRYLEEWSPRERRRGGEGTGGSELGVRGVGRQFKKTQKT